VKFPNQVLVRVFRVRAVGQIQISSSLQIVRDESLAGGRSTHNGNEFIRSDVAHDVTAYEHLFIAHTTLTFISPAYILLGRNNKHAITFADASDHKRAQVLTKPEMPLIQDYVDAVAPQCRRQLRDPRTMLR
jgi:hypothetical protein